jgi:hydrophobic/amphiphilic exporter-1 (mainly G- bacteria), HAE1 family
MDFVRFSINKPVAVFVGVILVVLFGGIGLLGMPYQLTPTVTEPEISVSTTWTGATPYEIEREIIEEQEEVLKGIPNLLTMESTAANGRGRISLNFKIGTDVDAALLRVSNKLNEVRSYPDNVDRPVISATGANARPVIWTVLKPLPGNPNSIDTYRSFFEDDIRQYLERVDGVADLFVRGGTEREVHVIADPDKLAAHKLTLADLMAVLKTENVNVSAGNMDVGRREYRVRTVSEFQSPEEIERVVISSTGQRRITVADVARVEFSYEKLTGFLVHNRDKIIVCGIQPQTGANILELTDNVEAVVKELNEGPLKKEGLYLHWVYDQRPYIQGAIDLVQRNLLIGCVLAVIVLLIFLQSAASTLVVAVAIPISVLGCFIFMSLFGRSMNVVSLAGISFAVGMLVDNAIVVLENIDRHCRKGKTAFAAAYEGTKEVWGAVLASTATTVAVFLPVIFMEEEAGQLFKDIAIAVTSAIVLSLFISISVIPMLYTQFKRFAKKECTIKEPSFITRLGDRAAGVFMGAVEFVLRTPLTRLVTVGGLTLLAVLSAWLLTPKMEYLPQGNQNFVLNIFVPPPGLSLQERQDVGEFMFDSVEPHMNKDVGPLPGIKSMFFVGSTDFMISGAMSTDEERGGELVPYFFGLINSIPGMFGISTQVGIFQQSIKGGRSIDVDLNSSDMNRLVAGAGAMFGALRQAIPGAQVRPVPSLELLFPEVKLLPDRERVKASGLTAEELGLFVDVLMDGRKIGQFKQEGSKTVDLVLKASGKEMATPEDLYRALMVTPGGRSVPVSSLAELEHTTGMSQIRHLERKRTITLQVTPPPEMPLEQAMNTISGVLVPNLQKQGVLEGINFSMSGAADKLTQTRQGLQWNFLLAVVIVYLLMSALFSNFGYPLIILFTVPLAAAGGIMGLRLQNALVAPQPMDILTMLGFVILIGVVVNNAILIVHQALNNIRIHSMGRREAVLESVRTRLRPIYMSACTSIFGMLPLVLAPGPGSELYRGLGSVILGGLALSTVFTVFVIPCLLMTFLRMERPGRKEQN